LTLIDLGGLFFRWIHLLAAITAVGGTIFMRFALIPAASTVLSAEQHGALREAIRVRWSKVVMSAIGLLLISGFINLFRVLSGSIPSPSQGLYHMLFGMKFLLALAIFFIASALAGRSEATRRFRDNARTWLTVNAVLAVILVCISGGLRQLRDVPARPTSTGSAQSVPFAATGQALDRG
jgi:uncharacterized membrane protein